MRKKSHINVISELIKTDNLDDEHIFSYKLGSIIPDIIPSFIYKRHRIDTTLDITKTELYKLIQHYKNVGFIDLYIARHIGIVSHYISDYFTYPHNSSFNGSIVYHNNWEKDLKDYLNLNINMDCIHKYKVNLRGYSIEEVVNWVIKRNEEYNRTEHSIQNDFMYIVEVTSSIIGYIFDSFDYANQTAVIAVGV